MHKNPQQRYQNANEIIKDFQETAKPSSTTGSDSKENIPPAGNRSRNLYYALGAMAILLIIIVGYLFFGKGGKIDSLAVLPFVNVNNDADTEYLSDGVTSSLFNRQAKSRFTLIGAGLLLKQVIDGLWS